MYYNFLAIVSSQCAFRPSECQESRQRRNIGSINKISILKQTGMPIRLCKITKIASKSISIRHLDFKGILAQLTRHCLQCGDQYESTTPISLQQHKVILCPQPCFPWKALLSFSLQKMSISLHAVCRHAKGCNGL